MSYDHSLGLKEFLNNFHVLYLNMFIFTTDKGLWIRELMSRIIGCDHSLGQKNILKFV
jgi:hypothetical protein